MKMNKSLYKLFAVCLLFTSPWLQVQADDLYSAEAEVLDESTQARKKGINEAFHQVLIQVTGDRQVAARQGIRQLLGKGSDYVQQFRFRVVPAAMNSQDLPQRFIMVRFDKAAVDRALGTTSASAWSGSRPVLLMWLAEDIAGRRSMLLPESRPEIVQVAQAAANDRGQPLQLPLMDLTDQANLSVTDLWAGYEDAIFVASARYPHDLILTGKIVTQGKKANINWTLYNNGQQKKFTTVATQLASALADGVQKSADYIQQSYAPTTDIESGNLVQVKIVGVRNSADFARVMTLLGQQDIVQRMTIAQALADELLLKVWTSGSIDTLKRSLMLGGVMSPTVGMNYSNDGFIMEGKQLTYRLN